MALIDKTIKVEQEIDDLVGQLVTVVEAIKNNEGVIQIVIDEVVKLKSLITDFSALSGDIQESFSGTLNAVLTNATELAASLLGKS